jgi:hypothetical protein
LVGRLAQSNNRVCAVSGLIVSSWGLPSEPEPHAGSYLLCRVKTGVYTGQLFSHDAC